MGFGEGLRLSLVKRAVAGVVLGVAVTGLVAWFWRKNGRAETVPAYGVAVFLAFVICNHMLWPYFYQPAIVAALCAAVTARAPGTVTWEAKQ